MNYRNIAKNFSIAVISQGVSLAMSILTSLLVPKILGVEQYGYWQLFIFYIGYCGLFQLGLDDGVYLINGGNTRETLDKKSINSQFWYGLVYQVAISVAVAAIALFGDFGPERQFVLCCTAVFVIVQNAAYYFGYILQALDETKRFSYSIMVERFIYLVPLAILLITRVVDFRPYVIAYIFSSVCQLIYICSHTRDVLTAGILDIRTGYSEVAKSIRAGSKLMLANAASTLILGAARFVIDGTWGIKTFGELSLALSMVNFFLNFMSQASMVLFPALRRSSEQELGRFFVHTSELMSLLFPAVYVLYFPLVTILSWWLPQYANSFIFLAYLLPVCVFDSKMNITCTTYMKVKRREGKLLAINATTAGIAAILCVVSAHVFGSVHLVISSAVVAIIGRSFYTENLIYKELGLGKQEVLAPWEIAITIMFVLVTAALSPIAALLIYSGAYCCYLLAFKKKTHELLGALKSALQ